MSEQGTIGSSPSPEAQECFRWLTAFLAEVRGISTEQAAAHGVALEASASVRFEQQVYAYGWHRLVRYASSPARGFRLHDELEELVTESCQEATIKFVRRLGARWPELDFPSFSHIRAYFFVVAKHCLVDLLRARQRAQNPPPAPKKKGIAEELRAHIEELQPDADLEQKVVRWMEKRLSALDRHLVEHRYFTHPPATYKEVAEAWNQGPPEGEARCTVGQLRVRKHRLIRDLVQWLREESMGHEARTP